MMEVFVYPVSAVLKFWHWLLASIIGLSSSVSWVASIILLVLTVRLLISPLLWTSYKMNRQMVLMRPKLEAIGREYAQATSAESMEKMQAERKQLYKEYGYNPFAGCLPVLIQIPVFLGLYRLLLWMAVPQRSAGHNPGLLNPQEVESFRASTLFDVPLPAYMSMSADHFADLGTTRSDVRSLAIPMLITAVILTVFNVVLGQIRTRATLDWANTFARRVYKVMWFMAPISGLMIALAGMTGLVPVALLLYWVTGNLFSTAQIAFLWWLSVRLYPLDDVHRTHIAEAKSAVREMNRNNHNIKRSRRSRRLKAMRHPSELSAVNQEIAAEKAAEREAQEQAKAAKKEIDAKRRASMREASQRKREELQRQKQETEYGRHRANSQGGRHRAK